MKDAAYEEFIERLRSQSDIVSIISDYVALKKRGRDYWGCCPFHSENTPSFSVSPVKGFFYCFGCNSGGNVFNFLMKIENISFNDAAKLLAQKLNVPIPEKHKSEYEIKIEREKNKLYKVNALASDYFHACLTKTSYGENAMKYLINRGISQETIEKFKLGYALPNWNKLYNTLVERGNAAETLSKAGLIIQKSDNQGYYDRFRDRIMYPITDIRGRVVGFGGRVLDNSQPKYLNSPETPVFNKRQTLYGLDKAVESIKRSQKVIIVEGYMDVISLHAAGITNAVASLGTAFSFDQAKLLAKNTKELLFAYDSDAAGQNATLRALSMVRSLGVSVHVVEIPDGKDPDEFVRRHGPEKFNVLIMDAINLIDYNIKQVLNTTDYTTLEGKVSVVSQIIPLLASIDNALEVNYYIKYLAQTLTIDESSIYSEYRKYDRNIQKDKFVKNGQTNNIARLPKEPNKACAQAERNLIYVMFEDSSTIPYVMAQLPIEFIQDELHKEIMICMYNAYNMRKNIEPDALALVLSENANIELSYIVMLDCKFDDITRVVDDYIKTIKLTYLQALYEKHRLKADQLERMGDSRFLQELAESQRIKNEIKRLY